MRAVESVDLEVKQGEFVTILGPSGSGKSTLLNLIAGLTEPTEGQIFIGGRDVTWLPSAQRNVGLVFQSYALFPNMTVAANVAFPLEVRGIRGRAAATRVEEALRLVRLTAAHDELEAGTRDTVGAVAERWGFRSEASFVLQHRHEYGVAPRE